MSLQLFISILSIVLFVSLGRWNHDNTPWRGLGAPNFSAIGTYETALRNVISGRKEFGRLMADDAVASLVPEALIRDEWQHPFVADGLPNPDVVIYKDGGGDTAHTMRVIEASGLTQRCRIDDTPFLIARREGQGRPACWNGALSESQKIQTLTVAISFRSVDLDPRRP